MDASKDPKSIINASPEELVAGYIRAVDAKIKEVTTKIAERIVGFLGDLKQNSIVKTDKVELVAAYLGAVMRRGDAYPIK